MTATTKDCTGCTHASRRLKWSQPRLYCTRFRMLAEARCLDYMPNRTAVQAALDYLKRTSIK